MAKHRKRHITALVNKWQDALGLQAWRIQVQCVDGQRIAPDEFAAQIDAKAQKTGKLLAYLAGIDKAWNSEQLKQIARGTFLKLQECWQSREYEPMRPLLMPDLFAQHLQQIDSLKRNHEIDKMDNIQIKRLEIVNVRYSAKREQQELVSKP